MVRCLLGVRRNTSIDLCLIETGILPIKHVLAQRRATFLKSKLIENDIEQPFMFTFRLCNEHNTTAYRYMSKYIGHTTSDNPFQNLINCIYRKSSHATKLYTYVNILNTTMEVHPVYTTSIYIPDYEREYFSRLHLMSHNLKIERRVCVCDDIQPQTEL